MYHRPIQKRLARFAIALTEVSALRLSPVRISFTTALALADTTEAAAAATYYIFCPCPSAAAVASPRCWSLSSSLSLYSSSSTASAALPNLRASPRLPSSSCSSPIPRSGGSPPCSSASIGKGAASTATSAWPHGVFWKKNNWTGGGGEAAAAGREGQVAMAEDEVGGVGHLKGTPRPRVVIIGGGMAGIAAAQRLQKMVGAGLYNMTILEASNRLGGRICSAEFNGDGIELGATWIHGIEGSPVYKTAMQIGAMHNEDRPWEGKDGFLQLNNAQVKAEGGLEVARELAEPMVELYKELLQDIQMAEVEQPKEMVAGSAAIATASPSLFEICSNYTSIGDFLRQGLDRFLTKHYDLTNHRGIFTSPPAPEVPEQAAKESGGKHRRWTERSLQEGCFTLRENLERTITAADDLYDIDLVDYNEYWELPGEHKTIGKGYSSVVEALASSLPPDVVQFGQKVEQIVWSDSSPYSGAPVNIYCEGGSVVEADHVIVTVSLGVLKATTLRNLEENPTTGKLAEEADNKMRPTCRDVPCQDNDEEEPDRLAPGELFDPPLPTWKLDSISRLGFGVVDKVFLHIEPAHGGNHKPLQFIFYTGNSGGVEQPSNDVPEWIRKTFALYPIHEKSHTLVVWFAGREALQVESLSDDEILSGISRTLTSFGIPESQQGKYLDIRRSGWGQNPLFRGSYSFIKVGSTGDDIDTLAEPLPKLGRDAAHAVAPLQLLFAGEATHRHYYSTTHGAYFSGLREAERILQHYCSLGQL